MRGGSSIVTDIFFRIASAGGVSHDDPITTLYDKNINIHSPLVQEKSESSLTKKSIVGIFRELPNWIWGSDVSRCQKILIIRDPRDCLVSLFYIRKKHSITPEGNSKYDIPNGFYIDGIDHFCLAYQRYFRQKYDAYVEFLTCFPDTVVIRYEDISSNISNFIEFVINVVAMQGGDVDAMRKEAAVILSTVQMVKKNNENTSVHGRSGAKLQFINELKGETIRELSSTFLSHLLYFGYQPKILSFENTVDKKINNECGSMDQMDSLIKFNQIIAAENGSRIQEIRKLNERLERIERLT